jgi:hypothetical protein
MNDIFSTYHVMLSTGEMLYKNIQRCRTLSEFIVEKIPKYLQKCYKIYKDSLIPSTAPSSFHSPTTNTPPTSQSSLVSPSAPLFSLSTIPSSNLSSPVLSISSLSYPYQPSSFSPFLQHSTTFTITSANQIKNIHQCEFCTNFHIDARIPGIF